jgi:hypothetical protein
MTADYCQRAIRIRSAGTLVPMLVPEQVIDFLRLCRCAGFSRGAA